MPVSLIKNQTINNYASFKGKWEKSNKGTSYYKTNEGTIIGGCMAIPACISWAYQATFKDLDEKQINNLKNIVEKAASDKNTMVSAYAKGTLEGMGYNGNFEEFIANLNKRRATMKKLAIPFAVIAGGMTIGCGLLVDKIRNKKAQEVADKVRMIGQKQALKSCDDVALSDKHHVYYKSNIGSKYGALLGAVCGIAASTMEYKKGVKISNYIISTALFTFGGWLLGKLTDINTNKSAKRHV